MVIWQIVIRLAHDLAMLSFYILVAIIGPRLFYRHGAAMSQSIEQISSQEETQVIDAIDVWLRKEVAHQVKHFDHEDEYPHEIVAQMKDMGLFSLMYPIKYGGVRVLSQFLHQGDNKIKRNVDESGGRDKYSYDVGATH